MLKKSKKQGSSIRVGRYYFRLNVKDRIIKVERIDGDFAIGQNLNIFTGEIRKIAVYKWFVGRLVHPSALKSFCRRRGIQGKLFFTA
jgi:hypothetical protein